MKVACFDIGGTVVKSALIDEKKEITHKQERATPGSLSELLEWMSGCIHQKDIGAISISVPGAVDLETGTITGLSAVPYIHNVSWYTLLADYNLPVFLENDANCVGLSQLASNGELTNFLCVVCGTGIGGALVINRHLVRGLRSYAGEFGYMMLEGLSDSPQNWSCLASTGSLIRTVEEVCPRGVDFWDGKKIFELAMEGHRECQAAIDRMIHYLAMGLMNLYYFCDPEVIYIGGGISQNSYFIESLQERVNRFVEQYEAYPVAPTIKACDFQQDANLMGAYMRTLQ